MKVPEGEEPVLLYMLCELPLFQTSSESKADYYHNR